MVPIPLGDPPPSQKPYLATVVELAARWYVFVFLNIYGLGKIAGGQFYRRGHLPAEIANTTLGQAGAFELAWTFMGYSFTYILFIGLAEVIGAWLLLWNKTKLLGVAVLLPVMTNIIVFDVIFLDTYGALASAVIYTLLLFVILVCNQEKVIAAVRALLATDLPGRIPLREKTKKALVAAGAMALLFALDQALVNLLGHGKG